MTTIGICGKASSTGMKATFDALGAALRVSFESRTLGDDRNIDGWVVLGADRTSFGQLGRTRRPCYVVLDDAELGSAGTSPRITFANRPEHVGVFGGREVFAEDAVNAKALPGWLPEAAPITFNDDLPWWAIQQTAEARHHYVGIQPPELKENEPLFVHFCGQRFAALLPLVLFVRSLSDERDWEPPPLQATFMFDDPNLHWKSYGFIEYVQLVRRAVKGNYHASFATIPLDAWFAHRSASAVFRENPGQVSLLYHGNDHVSNELARAEPSAAIARLLRQALGRIGRMEARERLEVARIMAPPHGACSEAAIAEMARVGFEAVCVSRGSLYFHNRGARWTRTIGMKPCDVVAGLPVIPRFALSKTCRNDVLLAAWLQQPIVPMTHHQAVADGFDVLEDIASLVNSLGLVNWRDTKTISRSLFSRRQDQGTLSVRMWSKRISVPVPEGTRHIRVDRPWLDETAADVLSWRAMTGDRSWNVVPRGETIPVESGVTVEIAARPAAASMGAGSDAGRYRFAAVARRVLTEGRDRALPGIHRVARTAKLSRTARYPGAGAAPAARR